MYQVVFHPRNYRLLRKIPKKQAEQIIRKIELLAINPLDNSLDIKKMQLTKRSYRLRIGQIRVLYEIMESDKVVWINKIDFRGNIYSN